MEIEFIFKIAAIGIIVARYHRLEKCAVGVRLFSKTCCAAADRRASGRSCR